MPLKEPISSGMRAAYRFYGDMQWERHIPRGAGPVQARGLVGQRHVPRLRHVGIDNAVAWLAPLCWRG